MSTLYEGDLISLNIVEDVIVRHSDNAFMATYEKNRKALLSYIFWRHETLLPKFQKLPIVAVTIGKNKYSYYEKENKILSNTVFITRTGSVEKTFFNDLDKPLLVVNEMNTLHWEYLYDRVRNSEDYGADNHVYMYFENENEFLLLLQVEDITRYLKDEKFIFLIGKKDKDNNYPLNLLGLYNIAYTGKPKEIRLDEINGLVVNWIAPGLSGNAFLCGVMDMHKNLLTTPRFTLSVHMFVYVYENVLKGKSARESIELLTNIKDELIRKEFRMLFNYPYSDTRVCFEKFLKHLSYMFVESYEPRKEEWLKAFYLAYAITMERDLNQRIKPMIKIETHSVACPSRLIGEMYDVFRSFKYFYGISIMRRQSIALASLCDMVKSQQINKNCIGEISLRLSYLLGEYDPKECRWFGPCYLHKDDEFLSKRVMIRFEDLKLHAHASLSALCDYLDIEWDDSLLDTTANGLRVGQTLRGKGTEVVGFDKAPVYNLHESVFSKFDHYRFEMLFGDKFAPWGYQPMFYKTDDIEFTEDEILKLFEIRFKFEKFHSERAKGENLTARKELHELIKRLLVIDYDKENMVPIPWLKPKMELVNGELYH